MAKSNKVTVYSADASGRSVLKHLREIIADLPMAHELGLRLFKRNLKAAYRQSLLGFAWALLPPLLTAALWIFLRNNGVMETNVSGISYPVFVITGTILWQIFSEALLAPLKSVSDNKAMLTKINIPREGLLLSGIYELVFNIVIKMGILAVVLFWYQQPVQVSVMLIWLPLGIFAISLVGFAIGLAVFPLGLLYQDISRGIAIILPFFMYLTPVVYDTPRVGKLGQLMQYNPLAALISQTRSSLTAQPLQDNAAFWLFTGLFLLLFLLSLLVFRLSMPRIIERMGS